MSNLGGIKFILTCPRSQDVVRACIGASVHTVVRDIPQIYTARERGKRKYFKRGSAILTFLLSCRVAFRIRGFNEQSRGLKVYLDLCLVP